jgi:hypothetical protein
MATKIKDIDDLLSSSISEFEEVLNEKLKAAQELFETDITKQVQSIVSEVGNTLGEGSLANAVGGSLNQVVTTLLRGGNVNARSVANTAARAFSSDIDDFFRQSSSQMADDISGFLGFGSRNN